MTVVALPWFVLETTGSAARMSLVLAAEAAPLAVLALPAGRLAGRLGARRTLLACSRRSSGRTRGGWPRPRSITTTTTGAWPASCSPRGAAAQSWAGSPRTGSSSGTTGSASARSPGSCRRCRCGSWRPRRRPPRRSPPSPLGPRQRRAGAADRRRDDAPRPAPPPRRDAHRLDGDRPVRRVRGHGARRAGARAPRGSPRFAALAAAQTLAAAIVLRLAFRGPARPRAARRPRGAASSGTGTG